MERAKLTNNNVSSTNISQSIILPNNILKNPKKENNNIIKHYKLIKNIRTQKENSHNKKGISNTLYLNNSTIKKKFNSLFNSPGRRINSTRLNPDYLYKKLKFLTLENNNNNSAKNLNKRKKVYKKLNAYYYSASIPMKNEYLVDNINQDKPQTMRFENENKVSVVQKKIDTLAKNLNLFQYKKKRNNLQSVKNPFTKRIQKISQKDFIQSYYNRQNDLSNTKSTSFPSIYMQQSSIDKTYYPKNTQKSVNMVKDNIIIKDNSKIQEKNYINIENNIKDIKESNNNNPKKILNKIQNDKKRTILKNAQTSVRFMESKDEFFYKNIFEFNNINRKKKNVSIIDNKLNIFYSENLEQYNQKMNRINDTLVKNGKPMIHQGVEKNSKNNMEKMFKKVQFIKKIIDYVYPNMVLYKVKQEKKRISKSKSLDFKLSRSQLNILNLKEEQNKLDTYFRRSLIINKY